jgi:NADPH-dependent 2,4-dienoyl-CoA reductase/sulfur reductase-like enzyme
MMKNRKIVIVGGVAGGATAAARLRRLDETSHIVLFERGEYISLANCGLPYYIGDIISQRDTLLLQTVEGLSRKYNLDIRNLSGVIAVNRDNRTVTVRHVWSGEVYEEPYDALLLSEGAQPMIPLVPGLNDAQHVFTLRSIPDADHIRGFIEGQRPKSAIVIGGGFIGLEMAENLVQRDIQVTLVEAANQVMASIDYEMAVTVHQHLREKGVRLVLGDGLQAFAKQGQQVILRSGAVLAADMVLLALGVRPENTLAAQAGLAIGRE